ncbi:MAG: hypothetical protein KJ989_13210 [Gammaproteobacteria bacterium]|uniref:Uncharacterized protein n=1 Tax=viral metagenome TaxID=1070528 RepID=A0A6M3KKM4_9ZZZZ|nr:hypothetical protein [Gammaproteobacteria bacterium]MBU2157173.1 hypothetical protein [Gammaproteobacteria bacterium]MBU2256087.1 hypothetical protein [Gammaproteobacteria bacterium]MBU2295155.1 hypothetical protein [Gammaproteobacteria bacterium]
MTGMTESAQVRRINSLLKAPDQLAESIALLKRANRYVGTHASIGGQALGIQITEFVAAYQREQGQADGQNA